MLQVRKSHSCGISAIFSQCCFMIETQVLMTVSTFWGFLSRNHFLKGGFPFQWGDLFFSCRGDHRMGVLPPMPPIMRNAGTKSHLKKQSYLKSQFPPEMKLPTSQQNFQSCLKSNFLLTPISSICFKKFSR